MMGRQRLLPRRKRALKCRYLAALFAGVTWWMSPVRACKLVQQSVEESFFSVTVACEGLKSVVELYLGKDKDKLSLVSSKTLFGKQTIQLGAGGLEPSFMYSYELYFRESIILDGSFSTIAGITSKSNSIPFFHALAFQDAAKENDVLGFGSGSSEESSVCVFVSPSGVEPLPTGLRMTMACKANQATIHLYVGTTEVQLQLQDSVTAFGAAPVVLEASNLEQHSNYQYQILVQATSIETGSFISGALYQDGPSLRGGTTATLQNAIHHLAFQDRDQDHKNAPLELPASDQTTAEGGSLPLELPRPGAYGELGGPPCQVAEGSLDVSSTSVFLQVICGTLPQVVSFFLATAGGTFELAASTVAEQAGSSSNLQVNHLSPGTMYFYRLVTVGSHIKIPGSFVTLLLQTPSPSLLPILGPKQTQNPSSKLVSSCGIVEGGISIASSSLMLRITCGTDSTVVVTMHVARASIGSEYIPVAKGSGSLFELTAEDLEPETTYRFRISADGSQIGDTIEFQTPKTAVTAPAEDPISVPESIPCVVSMEDGTSLTVASTSLRVVLQCSESVSSVLYVAEIGGIFRTSVSSSGMTQTLEVADLAPETGYRYFVKVGEVVLAGPTEFSTSGAGSETSVPHLVVPPDDEGPSPHQAWCPPAPEVIIARPTPTSVEFHFLLQEGEDPIKVSIQYLEQYNSQMTPPDEFLESESINLLKSTPAGLTISGLAKGSTYSYYVRYWPGVEQIKGPAGLPCDTLPSINQFHTPSGPEGTDDFGFLIQADVHNRAVKTGSYVEADPGQDYSKVLSAMAAVASSGAARFAIDLGDLSLLTLTLAPFDQVLYEGMFASVFRQLSVFARHAPIYLASGNHDAEKGFQGTNMDPEDVAEVRRRYLPGPAPTTGGGDAPPYYYTGNPHPLRGSGALPENYYAWTEAGAAFVVLQPFWGTTSNPLETGDPWDRTLGEDQFFWLKETLEEANENGVKFIFVFLHHLLGGMTNGRGGVAMAKFAEWGGSPEEAQKQRQDWVGRNGWDGETIHTLLVQNGATAVFKGHDHFYCKEEWDGIVYQTVPQVSQPYVNLDSRFFDEEYGGYTQEGCQDSAAHGAFLHVEVSQTHATVHLKSPPEDQPVSEYILPARRAK